MTELIISCKYYDVIVNFPYPKEDFVTKKLIDIYQEYIFNKDNDIALLKEIDEILYIYIINKDFFNFCHNDIEFIDVDDIKYIYTDFFNHQILNIKNTKWL